MQAGAGPPRVRHLAATARQTRPRPDVKRETPHREVGSLAARGDAPAGFDLPGAGSDHARGAQGVELLASEPEQVVQHGVGVRTKIGAEP